jgi:hypothetical protein
LDHLKIRVGPARDEHGAKVKQERLGEVYQPAREAISASFHKGASARNAQRSIGRLVELCAENAFKPHRPDPANTRNRLRIK